MKLPRLTTGNMTRAGLIACWAATGIQSVMDPRPARFPLPEGPRDAFEHTVGNLGWLGQPLDRLTCLVGTRSTDAQGNPASLPERALAFVLNRENCSESLREALHAWQAGRMSDEALLKRIQSFAEYQEGRVSLVTATAAGIAPMRVAGLAGSALGVGMPVYVLLNYSETLGTGRSYSPTSFIYDSAVGPIIGAAGPIGAGVRIWVERFFDNKILLMISQKAASTGFKNTLRKGVALTSRLLRPFGRVFPVAGRGSVGAGTDAAASAARQRAAEERNVPAGSAGTPQPEL